jgi:hypothetical protein
MKFRDQMRELKSDFLADWRAASRAKKAAWIVGAILLAWLLLSLAGQG